MYKIDEPSLTLIREILQEQDIYRITEFPLEALPRDIGVYDNNIDELRFQWVYDTFGFKTTIDNYNTFPKRVSEITYHGDYLKTLRQRVNIIHELIECNLDTNLPVHISIGLRENSTDNVVDLNNLESNSKFSFVFHPGQTRAQGSAFLKDELKNILLYVNKKIKLEIKCSSGIEKIETPEQLLSSYRPAKNRIGYVPNAGLVYNFLLPNNQRNLKYHKPNDCYILKCNSIYPINLLSGINATQSLHSSLDYIGKSFVSMNNYCKILYSNDLNVYTTSVEECKKLYTQGQNALLSIGLKTNDNYTLSTFHAIMKYSHFSKSHNNNYTPSIFAGLNTDRSFFNDKLNEQELEYLTTFLPAFETQEKTKHCAINYVIKPINSGYELNDLAKLNEYKGFCMYFNTTEVIKMTRDFDELLMCIPPTFSLIRTEDRNIAVINCEHEFWKTGDNFREYVLSPKFFN